MTPEKEAQRKAAANLVIDLIFGLYGVIRSLRKKK